nr:tyrosine-type recombinase/integrase [Epilithonimonas vandammei]
MLSGCKLLKHKILIGILYGCGLRCMEVRNLRLCDLDFDRKQLKVVQGKGKKDRYLPLSDYLIQNGNDCCFAHLGAESEPSSAFALHCSGRWSG